MHPHRFHGGSEPSEDRGHGCTEKCPDELGACAVRLVLDATKDPVTPPAACRRIDEKLRINLETLRTESPLNRERFTHHERPCTPG